MVAGVVSVLACCGTDAESTDSLAASAASIEGDDSAMANASGSVVDHDSSSQRERPVTPAELVAEPDRLCLRPGSAGAIRLFNSSALHGH
jgi:hypothetical protein